MCSDRCRERVYMAKYREDNRDRMRSYQQDYRAANREQINAKTAAWREANPGRYKEWAKQNAARLAAKDAAWRKANPDRVRAHINARRARLKNAPGDGVEPIEWAELLDWADHRCVYCGSDGVMTQDHVVPISRGGAHDITNIVPACFSCNASKCNRPVESWAPGWEAPWWVC